MNDIDKRLTRIEQVTQLQASDDVILIATTERWAGMSETERAKMLQVSRVSGLPILILD